MKYLTHIPKLSHAWRERAFRVERTQARESVTTLRTACDVLVRVSTAHLDRNYVDFDGLEKCGRQIVKLSTEIRGLSLIAGQPDAPRHEPVSVEKTVYENRTYAGVKASRLIRVLDFIRRLRSGRGADHAALRIMTMSGKLVRGLDVYGRVKALIGKLSDAMDNPAQAITPRALKPKNGSRAQAVFT